jgi:hypothetical protein
VEVDLQAAAHLLRLDDAIVKGEQTRMQIRYQLQLSQAKCKELRAELEASRADQLNLDSTQHKVLSAVMGTQEAKAALAQDPVKRAFWQDQQESCARQRQGGKMMNGMRWSPE